MTKIVFFFAGTNDTAKDYYQRHGDDYTNFQTKEDLIKIYVDGCQVIGNSALNPDLETPTNVIKEAFKTQNGQVSLDLAFLKNKFGHAIRIVKQDKGNTGGEAYDHQVNLSHDNSIEKPRRDSNASVDSVHSDTKSRDPFANLPVVPLAPEIEVSAIIMTGFSRGAWTANLLLPKLDGLGIPLSCVSDQAVTGKRSNYFGENATDCSMLKNLNHYVAFVGDYHKHTSGIELNWFYQWLPKLPKFDSLQQAKKMMLFYVPHQDHFESHKGKVGASPTWLGFAHKLKAEGHQPAQKSVSPIAAHMRSTLEQCVNNKPLSSETNQDVVNWYLEKFNQDKRYYFTPDASKLPVDGMDENQAQGITLESDPSYFEALRQFIKQKIGDNVDLSTEQAYAVYHLCFADQGMKDNLSTDNPRVSLVLSGNNNAQQRDVFIKIVNGIGSICDYMRNELQLLQTKGDKRMAVLKAINHYQTVLFDASFAYLSSTDQKNQAAEEFGSQLIAAERMLSSKLVNFPSLHHFFQMIRDVIVEKLKWGVCYAIEANELSTLKLAPYVSAYVRVKNNKENALYYVNGDKVLKLEVDLSKYDDMVTHSADKPLSKALQKAISFLTDFNPQLSLPDNKNRFFVPTPQQVFEYGAQKIMKPHTGRRKNRDHAEEQEIGVVETKQGKTAS